MKLSTKTSKLTGRHMLVNEGIKLLHTENKVEAYCPLGKNMRELTIETDIYLGKYIPDLLDMEDMIKKMDKGSYVHEDLIKEWIEFIKDYEVKGIKVRVYSSGHFPMYEEAIYGNVE